MKTIEFETAKKLTELGINIIPDTWWHLGVDGEVDTAYLIPRDCVENYHLPNADELELYPAYTLDEILEMLPEYIETYKLIMIKDDRYYIFGYSNIYDDKPLVLANTAINYCHKNPAEAAAQLLIWCIENGYVTKEEINNEISTKN